MRTGNLRASGFVVTDTQIPEHGGKFKRGRAIGKGSVKKLTAKLEENVFILGLLYGKRREGDEGPDGKG